MAMEARVVKGRIALLLAVAYGLGQGVAEAELSTAYSPCSAGSVMADGSKVRAGSMAHNSYPLGTRVWVTPAVFGRNRWTVRDRIGSGTEADFWTSSCGAALAYGRQYVRITPGWRTLLGRVRVRNEGFPRKGPR